MTEIPTKEKLAGVLKEEGLLELSERALKGEFDDYESEHALPIHMLVDELRKVGREDLATRAMNGEWDGSLEESSSWFVRFLEGKA